MIYLDFQPEAENFPIAVARGLRCKPKWIQPKYFYDKAGSELFEEICRQPEYYPTRTEALILHRNVQDISQTMQESSVLIEFGSGASVKTQILLDHVPFKTYVPLDISKDFLMKTAEQLRARYPEIEILPAFGDFTREIRIPHFILKNSPSRTAFIPGSTLGNFHPIDAAKILRSVRAILETGGTGHLLVGMDLLKDLDVLEAAYNDAAGITAQFNLNLLKRLQKEANADIDPSLFEHRAFFNDKLGRIEMHLIAKDALQFKIGDEEFRLEKGESIHTESSYKYRPATFLKLCEDCGYEPVRFWTDPNEWFGVFLLKLPERKALAAHIA